MRKEGKSRRRHRYVDAAGVDWVEHIQSVPWSSGPMIFLEIRSENQKLGWKEEKPLEGEFFQYDPVSGRFWV